MEEVARISRIGGSQKVMRTSYQYRKYSGDISMTVDLDEILRRITDTKNIAGVVVVNAEGVTVKSTLDNSLTALVSVLLRYSLIMVYEGHH